MPVTITDVANAAGVSKSTVSKVLNHWNTISPETTARVNEAIRQLHYIPNSRAVNFATGETKNIVYLTNLGKDVAFRNPHMFDIMCGVYHRLSPHGYTLTLVDTSQEESPGQCAMSEIRRRSADGLIIHGSAITVDLAKLIVGENVPHIIIGHPEPEERLCWIDTDHGLAGACAAAHMCECGYRDILFIAGKRSDSISNQRLKGFLKEMLNRRHHVPKERIGYTNDTRLGAYETVLNYFSKEKSRPQAVVCENSTLAIGAARALGELSLSIPGEVGLLTFDRYPYADAIDPTPTVIDINVYDMGMQAGSMMLQKLEHPALLIQSYTTLPVLIPGKTTAKISQPTF